MQGRDGEFGEPEIVTGDAGKAYPINKSGE